MKSKRQLTATDFGSVMYESGANPEFRVTSASRQAREMEMMLSNLSQQVNLLERREMAVKMAREEMVSAKAAQLIAQGSEEPAKEKPDVSAG
jgi:hypothetical protein